MFLSHVVFLIFSLVLIITYESLNDLEMMVKTNNYGCLVGEGIDGAVCLLQVLDLTFFTSLYCLSYLLHSIKIKRLKRRNRRNLSIGYSSVTLKESLNKISFSNVPSNWFSSLCLNPFMGIVCIFPRIYYVYFSFLYILFGSLLNLSISCS